jgi:hypothetical protein
VNKPKTRFHNLEPPTENQLKELWEKGKEARRKINKRFESVRNITSKVMNMLLKRSNQ